MEKSKNRGTCCEECAYYVYDDEYECYSCEQNLDSDEMEHFLADSVWNCPYYRYYDEYTIVRKQN